MRLPIVGRPIPIIADEYADPEKGSGAVKITPAHDFNDFQVGKRHNLPMINIFDDFARLNDNAPPDYRGLDRFAARKKVVEEFEALGLLRGVEKTRHTVPHGDRSGVVVEPYLTDQWYVDAKVLAQPAIKAVEDGRHRLRAQGTGRRPTSSGCGTSSPGASRASSGGATASRPGSARTARSSSRRPRTRPSARPREHYGRDEPLRQDEDVLDTWFSSALWPFSTLGWPEKTADLARFYPTHTLVTGFDIIFFWVARMMMRASTSWTRSRSSASSSTPWSATPRAQKMSKSKGNVMDPLELVDDYGADALRFTLTAMSGQARDIKLSRAAHRGLSQLRHQAVERHALLPDERLRRAPRASTRPTVKQTAQPLDRRRDGHAPPRRSPRRWTTAASTTRPTASTASSGTSFCDWYVELAKPVLNGADEAAKAETRATAAWVLDVILKLLHPVMPFLTEELWDQTAELGAPRAEGLLITAPWPDLPASLDRRRRPTPRSAWLIDADHRGPLGPRRD